MRRPPSQAFDRRCKTGLQENKLRFVSSTSSIIACFSLRFSALPSQSLQSRIARDWAGEWPTLCTVGLKRIYSWGPHEMCGPPACLILARVGEDSHFGFVAVMTPEHSSLNVHG